MKSPATRYPFACVSLPRMEILMSNLMSFDLWLEAMEPTVLLRPDDWPLMLCKAMHPWAFTSSRISTVARHFPAVEDVLQELIEPTRMTDEGHAHLALTWMVSATILHTARATTDAINLPPHRQLQMLKGQIARIMLDLMRRWARKADTLLTSTGHDLSPSLRTVIVRRSAGPSCFVAADIRAEFDPDELPDWERHRLGLGAPGQRFLCPGYFVEGFDPYEDPQGG